MKKIREIAGTSLFIGALAMGLAACEPKEGPAERAGKQVDKAFDTAGKKIESAGEKIQDAARDAKK
jgi:hypothetical protein